MESIRRFKGLESKLVILYNPPFEDKSGNRELLYTAVSRCVCYLIVITTKDGCKALKSNQGIQERIANAPPGWSQTSQDFEFGRRPQMAAADLESERKSQMTASSKDPFGSFSINPPYQSDPTVLNGKRPNEAVRGYSGEEVVPEGTLSREEECWDHQLYEQSVKQARNSEPSPMEVDE